MGKNREIRTIKTEPPPPLVFGARIRERGCFRSGGVFQVWRGCFRSGGGCFRSGGGVSGPERGCFRSGGGVSLTEIAVIKGISQNRIYFLVNLRGGGPPQAENFGDFGALKMEFYKGKRPKKGPKTEHFPELNHPPFLFEPIWSEGGGWFSSNYPDGDFSV